MLCCVVDVQDCCVVTSNLGETVLERQTAEVFQVAEANVTK